MQALSDEQHIAAVEAKVDRLERKVDDGFAEMRVELRCVRTELGSAQAEMRAELGSAQAGTRAEFKSVRAEAREDSREIRGQIGALHRLTIQLSCGMFLTMILGFAGILLQQHV